MGLMSHMKMAMQQVVQHLAAQHRLAVVLTQHFFSDVERPLMQRLGRERVAQMVTCLGQPMQCISHEVVVRTKSAFDDLDRLLV